MTIDRFLKIYRAYIGPVIVLLGIVGNVLVVLVFSRKRSSRFNVYSIAIVLAHTVALVLNSVLDDFLGRGLHYATSGRFSLKLDVTSNSACKLLEYLPNVAYFCASYYMVVFAVDRFLVMRFPFRFVATGGTKRAMLSCLALLVVGFVTALPLAISYGLRHSTSRFSVRNLTCGVDTENSTLAQVGMYYTSLVVFVIPTCVVLVLNIALVIIVCRVNAARQELAVDGAMSKLETARIVGMLAIITSFLLCCLPLSVVMVIRLSAQRWAQSNFEVRAWLKLLSSLKDISYSANFPIYFFFLSYFKSDLKKMLHLHFLDGLISTYRTENADPNLQDAAQMQENLIQDQKM